MGNDGGSIPTRRELVKSPTRKPTHSQVRDTTAQNQEYRWTTCQLSKRPLVPPIVSDSAGLLYNKDSILEWLLRGTEVYGDGDEVLDGRVKSLKDVVEVKFDTLKEKTNGSPVHVWVCSVSRKELGAGIRSVYLVPCGHAFSESAVKEIGGSNCITCNEPFEESNIIVINPTEPKDIDALKERASKLAEDGLAHSLKSVSGKKNKKRKKDTESEPAKKKQKESGIKNAAAASITAKVLSDEKLRNHQRKQEMNDNLKSLFSDRSQAPGKNNDYMTRGYSLPAAQGKR
ncbi:DUF602-domain-containing protein [Ascodesmis nigricans]|uniref:DUF602-domain-containing protein n=1 Tax=Ascodesmis nigricans TaxID=341454 RepID=A0A4S2N2H7_9PEZI|nr:DUF602-domain-containing protein [Ascodesmis nigricans]